MAKKNTTSAGGYKAGGGSQAKAAKSPQTRGMTPAQIAGLAASALPAGRAVKAGKTVIGALAKAAPGAGRGSAKIAAGTAVSGTALGVVGEKAGFKKTYADRAEKQRAHDSLTKMKEKDKKRKEARAAASTKNAKYRGK